MFNTICCLPHLNIISLFRSGNVGLFQCQLFLFFYISWQFLILFSWYSKSIEVWYPAISDEWTDSFHSIGSIELINVNVLNLSSFDAFCKMMVSASPCHSVIVHAPSTASPANPTKLPFNALPIIMYKLALIKILMLMHWFTIPLNAMLQKCHSSTFCHSLSRQVADIPVNSCRLVLLLHSSGIGIIWKMSSWSYFMADWSVSFALCYQHLV